MCDLDVQQNAFRACQEKKLELSVNLKFDLIKKNQQHENVMKLMCDLDVQQNAFRLVEEKTRA
jgi:hypothetical protein